MLEQTTTTPAIAATAVSPGPAASVPLDHQVDPPQQPYSGPLGAQSPPSDWELWRQSTLQSDMHASHSVPAAAVPVPASPDSSAGAEPSQAPQLAQGAMQPAQQQMSWTPSVNSHGFTPMDPGIDPWGGQDQWNTWQAPVTRTLASISEASAPGRSSGLLEGP